MHYFQRKYPGARRGVARDVAARHAQSECGIRQAQHLTQSEAGNAGDRVGAQRTVLKVQCGQVLWWVAIVMY